MNRPSCQDAWKMGWLLGLWLIALVGCSTESPNPASPPAPPAELPSALRIPESVSIDVESLSEQEEATQAESLRLVGRGELGPYIVEGAQLVEVIDDITSATLVMLNELEIPVSETTTIFSGTATYQNPLGDDSVVFEVKIDFTDFDYDGDGSLEGCSGHTAALPVCMRLWADGTRLLAAVFDQFPTEENKGAGSFKLQPPLDLMEGASGEFIVGAVYDHSDPADISADLYGAGVLTRGDVSLEGEFRGHIALAQVGEAASAKKMIRSYSEIAVNSESFLQRTIGQWLENEDYWSGSSDGSDDSRDLEHACASISSGEEITRGFCQDSGIDVEGIEFVTGPEGSDVEFSDDFPESPTF